MDSILSPFSPQQSIINSNEISSPSITLEQESLLPLTQQNFPQEKLIEQLNLEINPASDASNKNASSTTNSTTNPKTISLSSSLSPKSKHSINDQLAKQQQQQYTELDVLETTNSLLITPTTSPSSPTQIELILLDSSLLSPHSIKTNNFPNPPISSPSPPSLHITDRFIPSRKHSKFSTFEAYQSPKKHANESHSKFDHSTYNHRTCYLCEMYYPHNHTFHSENVIYKNAIDAEVINTPTRISQLYESYILGVSQRKPQTYLENNNHHPTDPYHQFTNENILRFSPKTPLIKNQQDRKYLTPSYHNIFTQGFVDQINLEKSSKRISQVPYKVLDAPSLQDDFYLNLIDWSDSNFLAVALSSTVYLWNAQNSNVSKLCEYVTSPNEVTSVSWSRHMPLLSIGKSSGSIEVWDVINFKRIRVLQGHKQRVCSLAQNPTQPQQLTSGSRDKDILHRDLRSKRDFELLLTGHKQEVCGLKWSCDGQRLASGGNDNNILIWSAKKTAQKSNTLLPDPISKFQNHDAAIKALAWSPHQHGLLATGGGTKDRTIRFWNTLNEKQLQCIDTGSQVSNLAFSQHSKELVSTHGFSQNQVIVWNYPNMEKLATLTGHTSRVLFFAMNPVNGSQIVTGAPDETLRFWNVFKSTSKHNQTSAENRQCHLTNYSKHHLIR